MPAKPKTINDYKAALLKLKVSLPAKNAKLGDYEKLWTQATTPAPVATAAAPSAPRSKRKSPAVASKSPAAQRQRRHSAGGASPMPSVASPNMPLSQPRASPNVPLSQQSGARARASPSIPLSQQRAAPARTPPNVPLSHQSGARARASPSIPLSQQRAAPARSPPNVPLSQQRPALVPIPLQPPTAAPPAAVPWSMPQPGFGMAGSSGFAAFGLGGGARAPALSAAGADEPTPSFCFGGEEEEAAAAEPAQGVARRALARLARSHLAPSRPKAAALGLLAAVALTAQQCLVLGVPALPALPSASGMLGGMLGALRELPQRGLHALLRLAASCAARLAHGAWWLLRLLPRLVARGVAWVWGLPRNEKVGGLVTLAALFFLHRALVWYERWRRAADADHAKLVDEAVHWAVSELKGQHERWSSLSGAGSPTAMRQAQRLHVSELQRRMPPSYRAARLAEVERGLARLGCRDAGGGAWEWVPAAPGSASPSGRAPGQGRAPASSRRS